MRGEQDFGASVDGGDGENVPGVSRDDVGGDEVDLVAAVRMSVGIEVAAIGVPALELRALDLDPEKVSAAFDGKIVGRIVAPGLGDAESELGGASHEAQLRPLAARLGVAERQIMSLHE